jgi:hypothetical protein
MLAVPKICLLRSRGAKPVGTAGDEVPAEPGRFVDYLEGLSCGDETVVADSDGAVNGPSRQAQALHFYTHNVLLERSPVSR